MSIYSPENTKENKFHSRLFYQFARFSEDMMGHCSNFHTFLLGLFGQISRLIQEFRERERERASYRVAHLISDRIFGLLLVFQMLLTTGKAK